MLKNQLENSLSLSLLKDKLPLPFSLLLENMWDGAKTAFLIFLQKVFKKNIILVTQGVEESKLFENFSSLSDISVVEFPSWETLPGENIFPSPDIIGRRMEVLSFLSSEKKNILLLTPLQALLQKTIDKELLPTLIHHWKRNTKISFDSIPSLLTFLGYKRASIVSDKGEFAIRGGIVDVFITSQTDPYRIEFFGDEISDIRIFDPVGQKTIGKVDKAFICPASEVKILEKNQNHSLILDYFSSDTILVFDDLLALEDCYSSFQQMPGSKSSYFLSIKSFLQKLPPSISKVFFTKENIEELSKVKIEKKEKNFENISFEMFFQKFNAKRFFHPFIKIENYLAPHIDDKQEFSILENLNILPELKTKMIFFSENERENKLLQQKLISPNIDNAVISFEKGYLSSSFVVNDIPIAVIASSEITKKQKILRQKYRSTYHTPAAEFHQLQPGDFVVHFHSGIGKYIGIEKQKDHLGIQNEFLAIEYAEGSKLFVPVSQTHLISRYVGSHEEVPSLSTLGSTRWQKTKLQAQKQIIGYASDLLHLYAERSLENGFSCPKDSDDFELFELDFPYVETKDQHDAIDAINVDMYSPKPMDRLICGDVGYGKTEVAMRASFKAVVDGQKQVAVLVPTTVLTMQHFDTFTDRMKNFAINIAVLSRFNKPKDNRKIIEKAKKGEIDILIGTHRILSKDVIFKELGLIVIDEEQRFGVRAKEHLKKLKKGVDCLTLSATPIPRTLYFSLINARDMSTINTPPQDRLPIKTILAEDDDEIIQNAILRELSRQGQAFFIHNRVDTILKRSEHIQKLLPKAKIAIVHGQMDVSIIDEIFHRFKNGEIDILFSTTIIENGVDIPNANTIIIDRSDTFGLADLYQLRGRVGRWNRMAYAYFITPKNRELSEIARKRLTALLHAGGYGGGMKIAMKDLEIRGAGDILGTQQSGQVSAIGFHLYCKLLKKTIDAIKHKQTTSFIETKIEFPFDAKLPEDYINETSIRMEIYYRFGEASTFEEVDNIFSELKDRFGPPPLPVIWLYHISRIRAFCSQHQFTLLKLSKFTLHAKKQEKKKIIEKTILLPQILESPKEIEAFILLRLKENFLT